MTEFVLDVRDFDVWLLPEDSRDTSSEKFRHAVLNWFTRRMKELDIQGAVGVDDEKIIVTMASEDALQGTGNFAIGLLQSGKLREGAELLKTLSAFEPENPNWPFNLGMALSDMGELGEACRYLERSLKIAPDFANAWVSLGVAKHRMGDHEVARQALETALTFEPENGYAHRNLGVVLMRLGQQQRAGEAFRKAHQLLPEDLQASYGYALWSTEYGDDDDRDDADGVLKEIIDNAPFGHPIVEQAKQLRSKIAQKHMREVGGPVRMDAVMYLVGAMRKFADMPRLKVQEIGFEIAMLGQRGIDVNSPEQKYSLRTLPGQFSGLHLMSLMYAAFKIIDPSLDVGFDLSAEYESAKKMFDGGMQ